jgi:predicted dehydrogenase
MKFLIAGFGSIGRRHFQNLVTLGERDIFFFRTNRSTLPDDEIDQYLVVEDLKEALAHNPDAVIISNPTSKHLQVALPAVEAGCSLLIEKPLSHSIQEVKKFENTSPAGIHGRIIKTATAPALIWVGA